MITTITITTTKRIMTLLDNDGPKEEHKLGYLRYSNNDNDDDNTGVIKKLRFIHWNTTITITEL